MEIGAAIFFTDYSITPTELAVALEQRGFDSLWVAEHSHIPVSRRFSHPQGEAALTKEYFDVMDPFVTLSAAAAVTTRLKLGTAVCLVIQRDAIQTAKVATIQGVVEFDENGDLKDRTVSVFQIQQDKSARPDDVSRQYHYIGVAPQS